MSGIKPGPSAQQASALSITPLALGLISLLVIDSKFYIREIVVPDVGHIEMK